MPYDANGRFSRTGKYNANGKKVSRPTARSARAVKLVRANTGSVSSRQLSAFSKDVGNRIRKSLGRAKAAKGGKGGGSGS